MIFHNSESTGVVASSGMGATSVARIATTAHMFSILSSRLYSDKVAAVLREIGCNALDAHIAAGKSSIPFEVKLPNQLDPSFYIKDWGPGLDEDGVRNLYMTYGESTKQNSNKFVGAMGLGSKSPFAYAHTFTIVAAKDGVKRFFTAYLNEDRVPVVTKTLEVPSEPEWPNGLMVTFPVEPSDMREFHEKARVIYSWFTVAPSVLGLPDEEKPKFPEFELVKPGRYGFKPKSSAYARSPAVVMGNIRYPLEMNKVYEKYPEVREVFQTIASQGVHLFVDIGEVMFTPNREALEYEKGTLETLRSRFVEVIKDIGSTLAAKLAEKEDTNVAYLRKLESLRTEYESTGLLSRSTLPQMLKVCGMSQEEIAAMPALHEALVIKATENVGSKFLRQDQKSDDAPYLKVLLVRRESSAKGVSRVFARKKFLVGSTTLLRAANAKAATVAFSASAEVAVFHLEGKKDGKGKVQALVAGLDLDFALLVIAEGGATEEQAAEYAEFIAGPEALDGYPVISTQTLDLPKERVKQLLNRRTTRLSQDERMQRIRVLVQGTGTYPDESTLYEAVQDGVKYYAVSDEIRGTYGHSRAMMGDNAVSIALSQDVLRTLVTTGQLTAMNKALGGTESISEVVILTPSSMKRVDPKSVGMVNIVDSLKSWFRDDESFQVLAAHVDDTEVVESVYGTVCSYYAPLQRLKAIRTEGTPFWKAIEQRYAGTDLMNALDVYLAYGVEREGTRKPNLICSGLQTLRGTSFAHKVSGLLESVPSPRADVLRNAHERFTAALAVLNWDNLCSQAENDEVPIAMAFFDLAMMLSGVMPVRTLRESAVA